MQRSRRDDGCVGEPKVGRECKHYPPMAKKANWAAAGFYDFVVKGNGAEAE